MKKLVLAAALSVAATSAFAGGMDAPVMEVPVMVEESNGSSAGGYLVPLLLLVLVAGAVAASN
ncbi:MAG: hypothetical protein WBN04_04435 [Paracoccaceae bacterium]